MKRRANILNTGIGVVGVGYVLLFARYFYLSSGREHFGNAAIAFLALVLSSIPSLGILLGPARPNRQFTGWRVPALVVCGLLVAPLLLLMWYED